MASDQILNTEEILSGDTMLDLMLEDATIAADHYDALLASHEALRALLMERTEERERLQHWKEEAIQVLTAWEAVWEAAGRPGPLGGSKAANTQAQVQVLTETLREVVESWYDTAPTSRFTDAVVAARAVVGSGVSPEATEGT